MEARHIALLVNPAAGGGRALKALPLVEAELARLGLPCRVQRTESIRHARELARGSLPRRPGRRRDG